MTIRGGWLFFIIILFGCKQPLPSIASDARVVTSKDAGLSKKDTTSDDPSDDVDWKILGPDGTVIRRGKTLQLPGPVGTGYVKGGRKWCVSAIDDDGSYWSNDGCKEGDDCPNVVCRCEDGSTVNSTYCKDGCCASKEETCLTGCAKHDGPRGSWNEARDGRRTGAPCAADSTCGSNVCLHGYCSKECFSSLDCPSFWGCERSANGRSYCEKK